MNEARKGKVYGWPTIAYGIEYGGDGITGGITAKEGREQPVYYWDPVIAPGGMTFYRGEMFPDWKKSVFIAGLGSTHLVRLTLDGERVTGEERLLGDLLERLRDVVQGPDGALYVMTDSPQGRPSSVVSKSVKRVSRPMDTKAMAKNMLRRAVMEDLALVATAGSRTKEKTSEAATKPRTNLGKRSHITEALAFCSECALHQSESRKAAMPIKTFCQNLTMVPTLVDVSPMSSPAATTEPVASSVPPSQAPATASGIPKVLMSQGWRTIMGTATIRTMEVT